MLMLIYNFGSPINVLDGSLHFLKKQKQKTSVQYKATNEDGFTTPMVHWSFGSVPDPKTVIKFHVCIMLKDKINKKNIF
jgi:hypothetical protein